MAALREKFEGWMRDEGIGPVSRLLLRTLSLFYGAAVRVRLFLYAARILRKKRLPATVISVGNITVGGTGKTPMAMHLAGYFTEVGKKVVILSRGYRGKAKGASIVSDGRDILLTPEEAGDEPCLMAERLKGVPVIVSPDRVRGGSLAIEKFSPDVIILDDGYQHIRLRRDLNILLVDSIEGFGNGFLLPRGILREHPGAIKRADVAMVKGGNLRRQDKELLKGYGIPVLSFEYRPAGVVDARTGIVHSTELLKDKTVVAMAGVANPNPFFKSIERLGAEAIRTLAYPDHHAYSEADLTAIAGAAKGADMVITTEKDAVKLRALVPDKLPLYALRIAVEIKNTEGLNRLFSRFVKKDGQQKATQ